VIIILSLLFGIKKRVEERSQKPRKVIKRNKNEGVRTIKYDMHLI